MKPAQSIDALTAALTEARDRTLELVADLSDEQMIGPRLDIVNPLRWEVGHVAWFQEFWVLRHLARRTALLANGDKLYDSARVAHDTRWDLPLASKEQTLEYMRRVLDRVVSQTIERSAANLTDDRGYDEQYFLQLALFHEQMHAEAITYTRQTLGYCAPRMHTAGSQRPTALSSASSGLIGDALVPGGTFKLGSVSDAGFVFDNELNQHEVEVQPFAISKTAVTNEQFVAFVEDGGYRRRDLWSQAGWNWLETAKAEHPVYWQRTSSGWRRRNFDEVVPLEARHPVLHVNWFEADAWSRWARRRLPTEAEWEMAACCEPGSREVAANKRIYPWGNDPPRPELANLDWRARGCIDVDELPGGDSAFGCRQMIGNTWEWTSTDFGPYPGFEPGPYKEYSAPWFGDHKVLRGGCWATRSMMIRGAYRNFYPPHRRDVWAGFRTCSL
jgi:ergothioneine biosynthesis protein EgtB